MAKKRTTLEQAKEADSLYETAITRWVEQQPELAAQAKKIMHDVTDCFEPDVPEVLIKMRSLPWGEFLDWYNNKRHRPSTPFTHWYIITRGAGYGLGYNEEQRTWHKKINNATVYHSVSSAEHALKSIENYSARIVKIINQGDSWLVTGDLTYQETLLCEESDA